MTWLALGQEAAQHGSKDVAVAVARVLQREGLPADQQKENPVLKRLGEIFGGAFEDMAGGSVVIEALIWALLAVACAWLTVFLVRRWLARRAAAAPGTPEDIERLRREQVVQLRKSAAQAEREDALGRALRLYLHALVLGLGQTGALKFRAAWTNRELVRRGKPSPEIAATLEALLDRIDPVTFGGREPDPESVSELRALCNELIGPIVDTGEGARA